MSPKSHQPSLLNRIARVMLGLMFIHAVIGKLTGFAVIAGAIAAKGPPWAPLLLVADQDSRGSMAPVRMAARPGLEQEVEGWGVGVVAC
jgi:uncharacterized membrane protein YphA (DoxX/SURF4 family)